MGGTRRLEGKILKSCREKREKNIKGEIKE
jgi:hypothetical protein